ncbi:rod shape-determining protein MreC [Ilumatobacter sp.]|uniref:rod shape-determining protein MreC n=1 Tax=Ilumatobacter sp. TaxID=1967498 RepID=UPI003B52376D
MAIYTVGRRRVVIALLLSAALLLTLDVRGNPVLDTIRDGFSRAMAPVETATGVVTNPVQRAWNSYTNYDDLERENRILREKIDRQLGAEAAAEAAIIDYLALLDLDELPSLAGIESVKTQVIGGATNNLDQIVEINKGSDQGIRVGMPVVNGAGLIGKITQVNATTAKVMLVTDPRYSVAVEILAGTGDDDPATTPGDGTVPSGLTPEEVDAVIERSTSTTSTSPTTLPGAEAPPTGTTPLDVFGDQPRLPQSGDPDDPANTTTTVAGDEPVGSDATGAGADGADTTTSTTTTTTIAVVPEPVALEKEFGVLEGRGAGRPSQIRFMQDSPSLAVLEEGDLVETAGGSESLAPPNIPVGRVINRADRPGVAGPLLEVQLNANLDTLNIVRVVLYRPLSEVAER